MTIKIIKEIGTTSKIKFKGLGHPGPFYFDLVEGQLPEGITFDSNEGKLVGDFETIGEHDFKIRGYVKDRIENTESFNLEVKDFTFSKLTFDNLVDYNGLTWESEGGVSKITNDSGLFDGNCYEIINGGLKITLPESIGIDDFELKLYIKPIDNGGAANARMVNLGNNSSAGNLVLYRNLVNPPRISVATVPSGSAYAYPIGNETTIEERELRDNDWNYVLLIRRNGKLRFYINYVLAGEGDLTMDLSQKDIYIGKNNSNTERFNMRIKLFSLRINDDSKWIKVPYVTDVWRYRFLDYLNKPVVLSNVNYNEFDLLTSFPGRKTIRLKEGYQLPTGLIVNDGKFKGTSDLDNNLQTMIELVIDGLKHDEQVITFLADEVPNYIVSLPLTGAVGSTVFEDEQYRVWTRYGSTIMNSDPDNLRDNVSAYLNGSSGLRLTTGGEALNRENFTISFWFKPENNGHGNNYGRFLQIGDNARNGCFVISNREISRGKPVLHVVTYTNGWQGFNNETDLVNGIFNHIVVARKDNLFRVFVNGVLVDEIYREFDISFSTYHLGVNSDTSERVRGNYFDLKITKYNNDYWEPFVPELITRWDIINNLVSINELDKALDYSFSTSWPHGNVEFKLGDNSFLPDGVIFDTDKVTGVPNNTGLFTFTIELWVNDTLNNSKEFTLEVIESIKERFLTHSINTKLVDDEYIIETNSPTIKLEKVSPVIVEGFPMIDFNAGRPYANIDSRIEIPHNETILDNTGWCFEADYYVTMPYPLIGRRSTSLSNIVSQESVVFGKSANTGSGEFRFRLSNFKPGLAVASSVGTQHARETNEVLDIRTKYNLAISYDGFKLYMFVDGIKIFEDSWGPMPTNLNQAIYLGTNKVDSGPSHFRHSLNFINNIRLYQGHFIYNNDYLVEPTIGEITDYYPVIEPNVEYYGKLVGIVDSTVSITSGSLPTGLVMDDKGTITGITNDATNNYDLELTITNGSVTEILEVTLYIGKYSIDLDFSNPIVMNTLEDNLGNVYEVIGNPVIEESNSYFNKSMLFDGSNDWLTIPSEYLYCLADHDFILEVEFVLLSDAIVNGGSYQGIISQRFTSTSRQGFSLSIDPGASYNTGATDTLPNMDHSKNQVTFLSSAGGVHDTWLATWFIEKYTKYKVRVERIKDLLLLYVNDEIRESVKINRDYSIFDTTEDLMIGCLNNQSSTNRLFHGYLNYVKVITTKDAVHGTGKESTGGVIDPDSYDPYWANVVALLHFDGDLVDEIGNEWTQRDSAIVQDGLFDGGLQRKGGSNSTYIGPFDLYNDSWTIEFHYRMDVYIANFSAIVAIGTDEILFRQNPGHGIELLTTRNRYISSISYRPVLGEWNHIAIVRDNEGLGSFYINGILHGSLAIVPTNQTFHIGYSPKDLNTAWFTIDELRITKGVARYTEDFTPPTKPFPNTDVPSYTIEGDPLFDYVAALLDFEGNTTDLTGRQWTSLGTADISTAESKFGGYSFSKVGKTGGLRSSAIFHNTDFCIDLWVYIPDTYDGNTIQLVNQRQNGTAVINGRFEFKIENYKTSFYNNNNSGSTVVGSRDISVNKWVHLAYSYTKADNRHRTYIDGDIDLDTINGTITAVADVSLAYFSASDPSERANDVYIDQVRFTIGHTRYGSGSFDPPSKVKDYYPLRNYGHYDGLWDNVVIYLPLDGDYIEKANSLNVTVYKPMTFTESHPSLVGDSLLWSSRAAQQSLVVETTPEIYLEDKDFCIELWVMPYSHPASGQYAGYFSSRQTASSKYSMVLEANGSKSKLEIACSINGSSSTFIISVDWPDLNKWTHIAVTREGSIFKIYYNGKLKGTNTFVGILYNQVQGWSLGHANIPQSGNNFYHGLMSDFKITLGHPRYTEEFIPTRYRDEFTPPP